MKQEVKSLKELLNSEHFTTSLFLRTKYKVIEKIVDKYQYKKLDNIHIIQDLTDDVINAMLLVGINMYSKYGKLEEGDNNE